MTRAEKIAVVEELRDKLANSQFFYIADSSALTVETINKFRANCFEKGVEVKVMKNTLIQKALEAASSEEDKGYAPLMEALKGPSTLLFCDTANMPAKVLKDFRKDNEKPLLKAAYIDTDVYLGDDQIEALASLKSKEDLLGDVITLLQSPMMNLMRTLNSGGDTVSGLLKALEERNA